MARLPVQPKARHNRSAVHDRIGHLEKKFPAKDETHRSGSVCHGHTLASEAGSALLPGLLRPFCYLPVYISCRDQLLCAQLRPFNIAWRQDLACAARPLLKPTEQDHQALRLKSTST